MAASTLALGQASYELLDQLDDRGVRASVRGSTTTLQSETRGEEVNLTGSGIGIEAQQLRVTDRSQGLIYNDLDSNDPSIGTNANISILANSDGSIFGLGAGNNRFNAARDLTNSEIQALGGSDSVRIGGQADNSFVSLGDGSDQFTVSRASSNLDVSMDGDNGTGDDTALFLGTLSAGSGARDGLTVNRGSNIVDMGGGDDRATFLGGVQGGVAGESGYELQLGSGNDTAVFGGNSESEGFLLDTGVGSDVVTLGRNTSNAAIDLGWNEASDLNGDLVVLGAGATLVDSAIRSGQSTDTLRLGGAVVDTSLDLGWGNSLVEADGAVVFSSTTVWDLGGGGDTLTFGEQSTLFGNNFGFVSLGSGADELNLIGIAGYDIGFDLGNDGDVDTVTFGIDSGYAGITISNFGTNDILFIGAGSYGYGYEFLNDYANEFDLYDFQQAANVIWQQDTSGSSTEQTLMTLNADELFTDADSTDGYVETTVSETSTTISAEEYIVSELANDTAWSSLGSPLSASENQPSPPLFPENLDPSTPA